jgi:hypothetical protein
MFAIFALALPALAESADDSRPKPIVEVRKEIQKERAGVIQNIKDERKDFKQVATTTRQTIRGEIEDNREQFKDDAKNLRANGTSTRPQIKAEFEEMRNENRSLRASTTEEIKAKREAMRVDIKNQILKFKEGKKIKLDAAKKEAIKNHVENAFKKLSVNIDRMKAFDIKIETKISERKADGADVSAAEAALVIARASLADATTAVASTQSGISDAVTTATSLSKEAVTTNIQNALKAIKTAHEKYGEVLKALGISAEVKASVKTETSASANTEVVQ